MKRFVSLSLMLATALFVLSGCNCYRKMSKNPGAIGVHSNPQVLRLKGNIVTADVTVTFPPKFFDEKAILKITPVLVFNGGEIAGTPKFVQGENVKDNFTVIPYKTGGSYTQTVTFPYDPRAEISTLVLRVDAKCSDNCQEKYNDYLKLTNDISVARGISTLQDRSHDLDYLALMSDNYKRVSTVTQEAQIMYPIGSSTVRPAELTTNQINLFKKFVKDNSTNPDINLSSVYAKGYASPDGPVALNDRLSKQRGDSGKDAISKQLKDTPNVKYDVAAYGEDWDGFQKLVEQSNMKDKDLVLQVLKMYSDPVRRDQEIKNMSAVFDVLSKSVLPELRRTKLTANADVKGANDTDLKAAAKSNMSSLNVEELLYAATLTNDNAEKVKIYTYAGDKFNDARAYNNLGVTLMRMGRLDDAKKYLNKAASIKSSPEISNNLGALALAQGDLATAQKYLSPLNIPEAKANQGLLALANGDYATAQKNLSGYDLAVAQLLNGNISQAKAAIANDTSSDGYYIKAIIAAREGDSNGVVSNLKSSIAKDSSKRDEAKSDIEFSKYFDLPAFKAL